MNSNVNQSGLREIRYVRIILGTMMILLIPYIAMQFNSDIDWRAFDFVVIGCLLLVMGFSYEFFTRRINNTLHRIFIGLGFLLVLALLIAELAVGIFGSPFAGS